FLAFPAALPFAFAFERGKHGIAVAALLVILIYPWYLRTNFQFYDYEEHSIAEDSAIDLQTAANGYWIGTPDPRWTMGTNEMALDGIILREQDAGRFPMKSLTLHLGEHRDVEHKGIRLSVFTGVMDDPTASDMPDSDVGRLAQRRAHRLPALKQARATHPPY